MPFYFDTFEEMWLKRQPTTILPAGEVIEKTKLFVWPQWAIDRANELVVEGKSFDQAIRIVSKLLEEKRNVSNSGFYSQ